MYYASLGKRFLAYLVDGIIVACLPTIFSFLFTPFIFISAPVIAALYFILFEGSSKSATPGKMLMKITVVDANGFSISYGKATLRYIGKILDVLTLGIGYLIAFFTDRKQALHDLVATTYVVDAEGYLNYNQQQNNPPQAASCPAGPKVVAVTGSMAGRSYAVTNSGILFGRDTIACNIPITDNNGVSRIHCFLSYYPQTNLFVLVDRNSSNGTFLGNGSRLSPNSPCSLRSGDRFYIVSPENCFEVRS